MAEKLTAAERQHRIEVFQRYWNALNRKRTLHYHLLKTDGVKGHQTNVALQLARYYVGLGTEHWAQNSTEVPSQEFVHLLGDPFKGDKKRRKLATKRAKARVARWKATRRPPAPQKGLVMLDGKQCAAWIAFWLLKARSNVKGRRWFGALVSGFRTAAYSIGLCIAMCGAVRCPGRCAGASTNHTGINFPDGAGDITDFWNGRAALAEIGAPLTNHLPNDPVHVSRSGY